MEEKLEKTTARIEYDVTSEKIKAMLPAKNVADQFRDIVVDDANEEPEKTENEGEEDEEDEKKKHKNNPYYEDLN